MNDEYTGIPAAAILHDSQDHSDELLLRFAMQLKRQGLRVHGVVQAPQTLSATGARQMGIIDLADGSRLSISQDRGAGARGCCVDPGALAEASIILRRACEQGADLVVVNRFGTLETEGGGFASDLLALMSADIPVLTVVERKYLAGWRRFTGGMAAELPPSAESLREWYASLPRECEAGLEQAGEPSIRPLS
ncbi:DUF2478 domain-containing protein [Pollutimonas bauzanensis]|uniref:Nucleoside-triphosphatase THEP1 n=1 Tax=Pollutimonas bauzanensis TaxID=658167 RepID=A0A1M5T4T7_9BURK|nr:DUF2478 domain-containing protein [Pollutimonas bauzanensis]SHH45759.1 Protein of unknown function [Pollutimonas bauzanensis]